MFSKSLKFSALLLTLGLLLGLAVVGCGDNDRTATEDSVITTDMKIDFSKLSDNLFDRETSSKVDTAKYAVEFFMKNLDLDDKTPEYADITDLIDANGIYNAGIVTVGDTYGIAVKFLNKKTKELVGLTATSVVVKRNSGTFTVVLCDEDVATAKVSFDFTKVLAGNKLIDTVIVDNEEYRVEDLTNGILTTDGVVLEPGIYTFNIQLCANEINEEDSGESPAVLSGVLGVAEEYTLTVDDINTHITKVLETSDFDSDVDVTLSFDKSATTKLDGLGTPAYIDINGTDVMLTKDEEDGLYSAEIEDVTMGLHFDLSMVDVKNSDGEVIAGLNLGVVHIQPDEEGDDEQVVNVTATQVLEPNN